MSYTEEQTRAYNSMVCDFKFFDDLKKSLSKTKCPIHNKKIKMVANWEREYDIEIIISNYCCLAFAAQIAKHFKDADRFASVEISVL